MNILDFFKVLKIDLGQTLIEVDGELLKVENKFDFSSRDFLRFAKLDLKDASAGDRGLINALTNAKRGIDCQIDITLKTYGIDYSNLPKAAGKIIDLSDENGVDLPYKLRLIQCLKLAPAGLISRVRTLRNKLEHYYEKPQRSEVKEAIELAELFIMSIESRLNLANDKFNIYDQSKVKGVFEYPTQIVVQYKPARNAFLVIAVQENKVIESIGVDVENELYYFLLRLVNTFNDVTDTEDSLKLLLRAIGHPRPEDTIKLVELII
ncbi:MAG: hypothetical protein ACRBG0_26880 [Lewinella sp.]|uniref:hypothetical protein n=1 Tax=Lewinella sp. TaxID=2004506 RepID=UPI003D6B3C94